MDYITGRCWRNVMDECLYIVPGLSRLHQLTNNEKVCSWQLTVPIIFALPENVLREAYSVPVTQYQLQQPIPLSLSALIFTFSVISVPFTSQNAQTHHPTVVRRLRR